MVTAKQKKCSGINTIYEYSLFASNFTKSIIRFDGRYESPTTKIFVNDRCQSNGLPSTTTRKQKAWSVWCLIQNFWLCHFVMWICRIFINSFPTNVGPWWSGKAISLFTKPIVFRSFHFIGYLLLRLGFTKRVHQSVEWKDDHLCEFSRLISMIYFNNEFIYNRNHAVF